MSVSKNVTKDNFRIVGNIEFSGDLMPIESGVHDLGSLDRRFRDIYLADHLDGTSPKIHFGDFDFTSTNIIEARDAAALANTALQPGTVDFTTDIWNLPTTLAGYGITDGYIPGDLQATGSSSLDGSATISTNDRDLVVSGTGEAVFESNIKAADAYVLGTLRLSGDTVHDVPIFPSQNNTISIGTTNNRYKSAYIAETIYVGNETFEQSDIGTIRDVQNGAYATAAQGALADTALQPDDNIVVNNATLSGTLFGPSELIIDPEGFGDITGKVTILGDLQVDGEMTTVNSTSVSVSGKIINLSRGSTDNAQANNSGIRVEGSEASIKYIASTDNWNFNKHVGVNTIGSVDASLTVKQTYTNTTNHDPLHIMDLTDRKRVYVSSDFDLILSDGAQDVTTFKSNGRIGLGTSNPLVSLHVNTTDAVMLPRGSTIQRPLAPTQAQRGFIRFNNETNKFEGFGKNNVWFNFEPVMDSDKDTYISAELSDGNDDDTLHFVTQGVEHMSLLPTGRLHLSTSTTTETDPTFVIESPNPSIQLIDNTNVGDMNIQWQSSEGDDPGLRFFRTDPTDPDMVIGLEGYVGINLTEPTSPLHVVDANTGLLVDFQNPAGNHGLRVRSGNNEFNDGSEIVLDVRSGTTNHPILNAHAGSYVGIGTASPARTLHVRSGDDNVAARFTSSDTAVQIELEDSTGRSWIEARNDFRFGNNVEELMRIDSTGDVGIGTQDPLYPLHIVHTDTDRSRQNLVHIDRAFSPVNAGTTQTKYEKSVNIDSRWCNIPANSTENGYRVALDASCYIADTNFKGYLEQNYGIWARAGAYHNENDAAQQGTGTINNSYAVYVDCLQSDNVTINNSYGIFQAANYTDDPDESKNYFASKVGIGTTNPKFGLDIKNKNGIVVRDPQGNKDSQTNIIRSSTSSVTHDDWGVGINVVNEDTASNGYGMAFWTRDRYNGSYSEKMRLDHDGNVGIGTTNPVYNLHLADSSTVNFLIQKTTAGEQVDGITLNSVGGEGINNRTGDISLIMTDTAGDSEPALRFSTTNGAQGTKHTMFISNGNVGIGNTNPIANLHIGSSTSDSQWIRLDTQYGTFGIGNGSVDSPPQKYFSVYDNDVDQHRLFITNSGDVGIGTTTPSYKLEVNGDIGITQSNTVAEISGNSSGNLEINNTTGQINFRANGSTVNSMWITSTGITLNEDVTVTGDLQVDGDIRGKLWTSNDYVLNTQIKPADFVVMEVVGWANPNTNGRSEYKDPIHLYVYKGTGWNGSAPTDYVYCVQISPPARSQFSSGTTKHGNDIDVCWVDENGVETDSCPNNSTTHTLKFKQVDPYVLPSPSVPVWRIRTTIKE